MAFTKETTQTTDKKNRLSAPSISLPKGGGAIRGMGEKFAANPVTGSGSMSAPIAVSPGRSGFGPQLSLSYDSGAGNGPFGLGWNLSLPSITRKTDKGLPEYRDAEESDVFILSGAEDLVPVINADGSRFEQTRSVGDETFTVHRYRPRTEGLFARIERWTRQRDGDVHWRSISRDNILTLYGRDENSRIADPEDPHRIFSWLICESRDDKGNAVLYEYKAEDSSGIDATLAHERNRTPQSRSANRYIKRIRYGNRTPLLDGGGHRPLFLTKRQIQGTDWLFEVIFDYGEHDQDRPTPDEATPWPVRPDPFSTYRAGFEVRTYRLCQRVLMFHHFPHPPGGGRGYDGLVRSTDFTYAYEQDSTDARNPIYSRLLSIIQSGYNRVDGDGYVKKSLPPLEFEYSEATVHDEVQALDGQSLENLPQGLDNRVYQWVDLDGEGIPGILTGQGGGWYYKPNWGNGRFGPLREIARMPSLAVAAEGGAKFLDLAGDGKLDFVQFDGPTPGFYERTEEKDWDAYRPFVSLPNISWNDPNLRFVDLTGDGHADVMITEEDAIRWYPSLGETGFEAARRAFQTLDEEKGPRLVFADGTETIFLADLSGDGLSDLVRIRNGEVCYWPNLGYGRFGTRVTMDSSPWFDNPDQFDPGRIRLADIDGSGTTDILYLHRHGVRIYFNQSGNAWSHPVTLSALPQVDSLASVQVIDLFGNGTACLVWSSPEPAEASRPLRYVDLMGGQKPHLLIRVVNNLGAETRIHYAPSTKFYLADQRAGTPWITRLPFPVHVVERVETYDHISRNRFVTRYAYHHGYLDGEEREFRGFGMVEQWDTEEIGALTEAGELPSGDNWNKTSHVPPVYTKTWFHTGVYLGRERVSNYFAGLLDGADQGEYYREPGMDDAAFSALLLPDTILPEGLSVAEEREACRALRGSILRQEVYALDGTDEEEHPYTVVEQNFTVRTIQPRGENRHAVFFTHPREAITYHYERHPADPRPQHALTLEVDDYGNVLKQITIGYGRRPGLSPLEGADREKQEKGLITYTENSFTNAIDEVGAYRTPLPAETRTYELTGITPESGDRFSFAEWTRDDFTLLASAVEIPYEQKADGTSRQKRLIEHVRALYRKDDLTALLPPGEIQPLALPGESYKLAFTPGLIAQVFRRDGQALLLDPAEVLGGQGADQGGYVDLEGDGHWWIPSGRMFYSPDPDDTPAQELDEARAHFFFPRRFQDPFGYSTTVTYDDYDLLLLETEDALGNRVTAGERDIAGNIIRQGNDYRVLQPWLVSDANRNRQADAFDALGFVAGRAMMGKPEENLGDSLDDFEPDLPDEVISNHLASPLAAPHAILGSATTRMVYDLFAYYRTKDTPDPQPPVVYTRARETHESDLAPSEQTKIQHSFSYSDGFGREIQKKIQAEPGPVPLRDADGNIIVGADGQPQMTANEVSPRWVGSGWTVFNNKGKPVRKYEPFFTDTHLFEFEPRIGVSPILFYDPLERVVAALHPNHTWEKMIFDPWRQESWDVNDTVLLDPAADPDAGGFFRQLPEEEYLPTWYSQRVDGSLGAEEQKAAQKTAIHAGTPTVTHFDALGRAFLTVAHNRFQRDGETFDEKYETRTELDIEGNTREVIDAKGRVVMRYDYHMAQPEHQEDEDEEDQHYPHLLHQASMEAGERWMLSDVAGNPVRTWDSRKFSRRMTYDKLRRPTGLYVTEEGVERLVERTEYGEEQGDHANHRTRIYQQFDQAGIVTYGAYDFKGNLLKTSRRLAKEHKATLNWDEDVPLEQEIYESITTYDTLNRPTTVTTPDHSVMRHTFNEANLLEKVDVALRGVTANGQPLWTPFVTDIDYNAKGQRTRIDYGNSVSTFYAYDPLTYRLMHLETRRNQTAFPDDCPRPSVAGWPGCQVQNLHYTYDPAGNITHIRDEAQQTIFFRNKRGEPCSDYTYDALYRLIEATGREHLGQNGRPIPHSPYDAKHINLPHPGDGSAMGRYLERYIYDEVGNFIKMQHRGSDPSRPGWTRTYSYEEPSLIEPDKVSNRLSHTTVGNGNPITETYAYDAHGNMTSMPHLSQMDWDFNGQLQNVDMGGGGTAYYIYDASGERARKVVERQNGTPKEERIYLGGFEIYRRYNGSGTAVKLERETLHIMDDKDRIALVETRTQGDDGSPRQLIRYQLGNHLGSVSLELDEQARIISYEEYSPYGSTTYQAVNKQIKTARKRYRFTGKERDEETGLNYHSARYYAPWLGRWVSCDPGGLVDGINIYRYSMDNPVRLFDKGGRNSSFWNKVGNFFHGIGSKIKSVFHNIGRGIGKAAKSLWNWVIAPSIRTFTNALMGGLLFGGIGFVVGLVSGAIHGWAMAKAHTYNWSSFRGWLSFIVDNTWSLLNSFAASIWTATNFIFGNKIDYRRSFHSTALVFKRGLIPGYDTTIGNVIAGSHDDTFEHEMIHVFQARLFGPLYLPTVALNYILFAVVPVWLLWEKKEIRSFRDYLEGIYRNVWNEIWAYSATGRHPAKNTYNKSGGKNAHHPTRRYHSTNTNNAQNNHSLNCVHCMDIILYKSLRIPDFIEFKGKRKIPVEENKRFVPLKLWPIIRF